MALFFVIIIYFLKTTKMIFRSWRDSTKNQAFAGSKAPTYSPAGLKNPGHVGVARRITKALRAARRQHACPPAEKTRLMLAGLDEESKLCGQQRANMTSPRLQSHPADASKRQIPTPFVWESAFLHLCFCTYNFYFFDWFCSTPSRPRVRTLAPTASSSASIRSALRRASASAFSCWRSFLRRA